MVAHVHRTLLKGGVFLYPPTAKGPEGKPRLMCEANPTAFIVEQAGGEAYAGRERLPDLQPKTPHQRTTVILGSAEEVEHILCGTCSCRGGARGAKVRGMPLLALAAAVLVQAAGSVPVPVAWHEVPRDALAPLCFAQASVAPSEGAPVRLVLALPSSLERTELERAAREVAALAGPGATVIASPDPLGEWGEIRAELGRRRGTALPRLHVVGWGQGGAQALRLAGFAADALGGVVALAPTALAPEDLERLDTTAGLPIALLRGREDERGTLLAILERRLALGEETALDFVSTCERATLACDGGRVRARLGEAFAAESARAAAESAVRALLDRFHAAAARADGADYFACLAADAVFLGTDAKERWSVPQFRAYCEPYFAKGRGWTYAATERHVTLSRDRATAWFDERLQSASYGEVRGSGALRRDGERWRITQYVMSLPVPNELASGLIEKIRARR